jgi:leucyl/phenylalanyl-tRNA--protein transferase
MGVAHSVETWLEGKLVGGLYGLALGGAFFGESMFSRIPSASKFALVSLVERLHARGYRLLDTQIMNEHMRQFGAVDIPRDRYLLLLSGAVSLAVRFHD